MSSYRLEARIIQKKDQLEELSATGAITSTPIVDEVRTGQQFLIKLHLLRNGNTGTSGHMPARFPTLRVARRVAINTAGDPRTDADPLTLEIGVHLAKSGTARKGACAKCCHKVKKGSCRCSKIFNCSNGIMAWHNRPLTGRASSSTSPLLLRIPTHGNSISGLLIYCLPFLPLPMSFLSIPLVE